MSVIFYSAIRFVCKMERSSEHQMDSSVFLVSFGNIIFRTQVLSLTSTHSAQVPTMTSAFSKPYIQAVPDAHFREKLRA